MTGVLPPSSYFCHHTLRDYGFYLFYFSAAKALILNDESASVTQCPVYLFLDATSETHEVGVHHPGPVVHSAVYIVNFNAGHKKFRILRRQ